MAAAVASAPEQGEGAEAAPPARLHCMDALTADFSADEQGERAKTVMQSAPRMPAVGFYGGRYGERWYVDVIALPHNAVRRQLFDAFLMANALGKLLLDVAEADLARVYAWLGTLDTFVQVVFAIEDKFIYPMVDTHVRNARTADGEPVYLPELLSARGRQEAKAHVLDLLADARKTRDVATGETVAKIVALRYALDQFGANILDYFSAMEHFAPKLLKKAVKNGEREKQKLERRLFEYVLEQPQGAMLAALLTQCIESRTRRKDFIERNIRKDKWRAQFRAHVKSVENTHMQLARTFDQTATQYERRFNVTTFVEHYDANKDGKQTLEMFGDTDLNYESVEEGTDTGGAVHVDGGVHEPRAEAVMPGQEQGQLESRDGVGLDDDVIEVHADPEEAEGIINNDDDDDQVEIRVPVHA